MVLLHTSKIEFLSKDFEIVERPNEWSPVSIVINGNVEEWEQNSLFVNNRELSLSLKRILGVKKIVTDPIRLGSGNYKVKLISENETFYDQFPVFPYKISKDAFYMMLEELTFQLPADISVSLSELGAFSGVNITQKKSVTIAQELLRLKRTIFGTSKKPGLIKMIEMVAKNPHHILMSQNYIVRRENARKVDPLKIMLSYRKPGNLDTHNLPITVTDTRVEHSYNTYENQLLKLFSNQVQIRLRKLVKLFNILRRPDLASEAFKLQNSFQSSLRRASFLDTIDLPRNFKLKSTMVLLNVPVYKSIFEGFIEFQKVISSNINDSEVESPLENTPSLYQKWATLKVLACLMEHAIQKGYAVKEQSLFKRMIGDTVIGLLPDGRPSAVLVHPNNGTLIKFIPERSYINNGNPLNSISFTQKPDISIEVTKPNEGTVVYLLDPKYKLESEEQPNAQFRRESKPKKIDIDKMHTYRDAIRDKEGKRVVVFAATLYPGESYSYGEGLNAIKCYPGESKDFDEAINRVLVEILN